MKKQMTIEDLAALMIKTMASKEDVQSVKNEVQQVRTEVTKRLDDLYIEVQKIDNKVNRVENYKIMQLELIKLLREKKVITAAEAHQILSV